jgi:regulator of protease activity HflC (stomatin/prohibitin superfamily)
MGNFSRAPGNFSLIDEPTAGGARSAAASPCVAWLVHEIAWLRLPMFAAYVVLSGACTSVPPGHAAVVFGPAGVAAAPLPEGVHFVGPRASAEDYDLRAQETNEDLQAVSRDGALLEARASVLTFRPAPGELVALSRELGPDYYRTLVRPVVRSVLRRVLAGVRAHDLDTSRIIQAENEVTDIAARLLRPRHVVFEAISLRTLGLIPSSAAYQAVVDTGVEEQRALAARQLPELARRHAEQRRAQAAGIVRSHVLIAPTLSPQVLADAAHRAWTNLLTAPGTRVEVRASPSPPLLEVEP